MVHSNKYYKPCAEGVTTDRDLAESSCLRNTTSFIPPRYRKTHGTSHDTKNIKTNFYLFNNMFIHISFQEAKFA